MRNWGVKNWIGSLEWSIFTLRIFPLGIALASLPAIAQIIPDQTLGNERSRVTPNVTIKGATGERIDGGAVRGSSLFHSFSEFNVNAGQQVYFRDPAGIANILTRVTGSNVSNILGKLGVDGAANLYLLNPNGIIFGPNAQLDIQGSFFATTGNRFVFPNGMEFGATNPQAPPLLSMSVPIGVQYGTQPGNIVNTGNLKVGQDLTLAAGNLDLQGQLVAGRDLTLQAQNTVKVRDTVSSPFIASAGGKLVVQGNQAVDIFALNHPNSGLFSGGDMVLRSANTVGGDAHYWSGGSFGIETLDGNLGNLFSPNDPVIRASGDVSFGAYTGASLHILAGGSVTITRSVTITGADPINGLVEDVTLSDGTIVAINGRTQPTLDIRAGTTAFGTPGTIGTTTPTSANITVGSIQNLGGLVLLTNQYQPNLALAAGNIKVGNIDTSNSQGNGGSITIDARDSITIKKVQTDDNILTYLDTFGQRNGGAITLIAGRDISTPFALLDSHSLNGNGGEITLTAGGNISEVFLHSYSYHGNGGDIILTADGNITINTLNSFSINDVIDSGTGGDITVSTTNGNILLTGDLNSFSYSKPGNSGTGGKIFLSAKGGNIQGSRFEEIVIDLDPTTGTFKSRSEVRFSSLNSFSFSERGTAANGGKVTLEAKNNVSNLDILTLSSFANAKAGDVQVEGFGDLSLADTNILTSGQLKVKIQTEEITLDVSKAGQSGDVAINSLGNLTFNNSRIESDTKGSGAAGNVTITSPGLVTFNNSQIVSNTSSTGQAGSITLKAPSLQLDANSILSAETSSSGSAGDLTLQPYDGGQTLSVFLQEGAQISASTANIGQGGNITITAPESVTLSGKGSISATTSSSGQAGSMTITTPTLAIDGTQISTSTSGSGKGGDLNIMAPNSVTLSNNGQLSAETTGSGQAGNVNITTPALNINTGAKVSTTTTQSATGTGGDITVSANTLNLSGSNSGLFAETQGAANAGNLRLNPYSGNDLQVNFAQGAKVSASTSGSGTGGNMNVTAPNSVTLSGDGQLSAEATNGGNAGKLEITANQLTLRDNSSATVSSTGNGTAGNLTVNAPVVVLEQAKLTATTESGSGGNIQLQNLSALQLFNNSEISASTASGNGGSVSVIAPGGSVALNGNSNLKAEATNGGTAGNLEIVANKLTLRDNSSATVSSTGSGTAGKLSVSAPEVILDNFAKLTATTVAGSGGNIQLQNLSALQLSNNSEISASTASGTGGSVSVNAPGGSVALTGNSNLKAEATNGGTAGNLDITASQITLRDSSATVSSPQGQAGNLFITANTLSLNAGKITAETGKRSDIGGANINLQLSDLLLLRNQSLISANAIGDANGGNITIKVPFIIALPSQNSDIIANAVSGDGGRIDIFANRVFGLKPQTGQSFDTLRKNRTNDLSASSQSGIQGTVNIQSLSIDPSQGLAELPTVPIDPSSLIAQGCGPTGGASARRQSEFVVTGRGGLPPGADELQSGGAIAPEWVTRDASRASNGTSTEEPTAAQAETPLVEAQGMVRNTNGDMVLTAQAATATPHQSGLPNKFCSPAK